MLLIRRRGWPSSRSSSRSAGGGHSRRLPLNVHVFARGFGSGSLVDCVNGRRTRIFGSCGCALACSIAQFLDHCVLSSLCCMSGGAIASVMCPLLSADRVVASKSNAAYGSVSAWYSTPLHVFGNLAMPTYGTWQAGHSQSFRPRVCRPLPCVAEPVAGNWKRHQTLNSRVHR